MAWKHMPSGLTKVDWRFDWLGGHAHLWMGSRARKRCLGAHDRGGEGGIIVKGWQHLWQWQWQWKGGNKKPALFFTFRRVREVPYVALSVAVLVVLVLVEEQAGADFAQWNLIRNKTVDEWQTGAFYYRRCVSFVKDSDLGMWEWNA